MKKQDNNSARQITLTVALVLISAILLASTSNAAPTTNQPNQSCGRIDTPDVVLVQGFFQGIGTIAGCRLTAADAVHNGTINTQDVLATQRFYLGFTNGIGSAGTDTGCGLCFGDSISSTNSPLPEITVSLPTTNLDTSVSSSTVINIPVVTTNIDPSLHLVGFQGDFTFDERVLSFSSANAPVFAAGLTVPGWTVAGHILSGPGPFRTLRVSAFGNDVTTPLSGSGTLFNLKMVRVSNTLGDTSNLVWTSSADDFQFVQAITINTFSPTQTDGMITIVSNPTPTPTPTPSPTATPIAIVVSLPVASVDISTTDFSQPITVTTINASDNLLGFQGDFTFDSAIVSFQTPAVSAAGLTANNWNVGSSIIQNGPGTMKTLRIGGYVLDGNTGLSGEGTLFTLNMTRVSSTPGANTALTWTDAFQNLFAFIGLVGNDVITEYPSSAPPGSITITATPSMNISGTISHCSSPSSGPAADVTLDLTGTESGSAVSDESGAYMLSSLTMGGSYTVTPAKAAVEPGSPGITTVDMMAAQRHALGMTLLSGCALTAADVNGDGNVTTVDVIAIQRFYLGFGTGIGNTGKYQFTPASRSYSNVGSDQTNQNFDALIFGDVTGSFANQPAEGSPDAPEENELTYSSVTSIDLPEITANQSRRDFIAPVTSSTIDARENLVGFQGDFTFDERVVNFATEPVQAAGLTARNWNVAGNVLAGKGPIRTLRISAYSMDFVPLSGVGTLFDLKIAHVKSGAGSSPLIWAAPPNNFIFINGGLMSQEPGNTSPGSISPTQRR